MKAQLTFDLDNLDDELRYYQCIRSEDMALALWDIAHNLRKKVEWEIESQLDDTDSGILFEHTDNKDPLDIVFERIAETIEKRGINITKITR